MIRKKDYSDIINLPHHVSKVHPRMSLSDRAAQFAPFAALNGHSDAIEETARCVDQKRELDDYQKLTINEQLHFIDDHMRDHLVITMIYFQADRKKQGGKYLKIKDCVKKIDIDQHMIVLENGIKIRFDDIYDVEIES